MIFTRPNHFRLEWNGLEFLGSPLRICTRKRQEKMHMIPHFSGLTLGALSSRVTAYSGVIHNWRVVRFPSES